MPELPDVAGFRQHVDETSRGRRIHRVEVRDASVLEDVTADRLRRVAEGRTLGDARRHGKHLFVDLDGAWLAMHFGMTGMPVYVGANEEEPRFSRVVFALDDGDRLAFDCQRKLGRITLTDGPEAYIAAHSLGPDALDGLQPSHLADLLAGRRGTVKAALMNQSLLARIGNVWSDEILYQARVDPRTDPRSLDPTRARSLGQTMRKALRKGVERRGVVEKLPRTFFLPHRDGDGVCPRCKGAIEQLKFSGRTAYWCPNCQGV